MTAPQFPIWTHWRMSITRWRLAIALVFIPRWLHVPTLETWAREGQRVIDEVESQ